jgi:hypothetical protein
MAVLYINTGRSYNRPMRLLVHIKGATDQDQERAVAAAWQVFEEARTYPYEAAAAIFKMEGETEDLTAKENALVHLWHSAETAAVAAGSAKTIDGGRLELEIPRVR